MIAFIDTHRARHGVEPICRVLPIAPSTYHAHAARRADPGKLSARAQRDITLMEAPERKSLTEAAGRSGGAGVKIRQQIAFVGKWQRLGDEGRGALCSGSLRGSD